MPSLRVRMSAREGNGISARVGRVKGEPFSPHAAGTKRRLQFGDMVIIINTSAPQTEDFGENPNFSTNLTQM